MNITHIIGSSIETNVLHSQEMQISSSFPKSHGISRDVPSCRHREVQKSGTAPNTGDSPERHLGIKIHHHNVWKFMFNGYRTIGNTLGSRIIVPHGIIVPLGKMAILFIIVPEHNNRASRKMPFLSVKSRFVK